jgi:hypothetical protein
MYAMHHLHDGRPSSVAAAVHQTRLLAENVAMAPMLFAALCLQARYGPPDVWVQLPTHFPPAALEYDSRRRALVC